MKKVIKKLFSLSLVLVLLLTSFGLNNLRAEEESDEGVELSFEVVENDPDKLAGRLNQIVEEEDDEVDNLRKGNVRVSIVLDKDSTIDNGYSTENIALDPSAIAYRESLKKEQNDMAKVISKEVLDGQKLDVVWNLTLAANIISANVPYDKIEEIKQLDGVKDVIVETQYFPDVYSQEEDDPNMSTATEMISAQFAWASGYTGAGSKIAIVDTGLDIDHQSFSSYAYDMAIQDIKSKTGKDITIMSKSDVTKLWGSTNAYAATGASANDAYLNSKVPFRFNYVDSDFDVTHINDTQGEHGSHVASISAGNRYIYKEAADGSISLVNALSEVKTQGSAPDAQLLVMKVFGKGGGAYDSDYFAAIEDAIVLGADSVNLSLGSSTAGFSKNSTYQELIDGMANVNVVWANSAGNNGSWADQTPLGYLYSEDANFASGGSPATYSNTLSVASVDNKGFTGSYFEYAGNLMFYTESDFSNEPIKSLAGEHEFVYIDAIGTDEQFALIAEMLQGKVALCNRGTTSFFEKAEAAVKHGAIATVVVNNQPGTISMDLSDYSKTQPVVSITLTDGEIIKANSDVQTVGDYDVYTGVITVSDQITTQVSDSDYYTMSSFSSYGVPGSLNIKPEITAPGGNIYAVNGLHNSDKGMAGSHTAYENMSGTSMASPQVAGLSALMGQFVKENNLDAKANELGLTRRAFIQSLLMSTATPLVEEDSDSYYSVMKQGAGLANIEAAMNSSIVVLMDRTAVNGVSKMDVASYSKDGKVKAELGDDPDRSGKYTVEFTLNNITDTERYFDLDGSFFTQDIFSYGNAEYLDTWTVGLSPSLTWYINGDKYIKEVLYDFNDDQDGIYDDKDAQAILDYVVGVRDTIGDLEYADLDQDGDITTYDAYLALKLANQAAAVVPANGSTKIRVDIDLAGQLDEYDNNGAYVEGFLFASEKESQDGAIGVEHSIPVLGYYGSWSEPSMFDIGSLIEFGYDLETRDPYMSVATAMGDDAKHRAKAFVGHHNLFNINYGVGGNPLGADFDNGKYHPERNAFSSKNKLVGAQYSLIRNAAASKFELRDDSGELLSDKQTIANQYAAYYYGSQRKWFNTNASSAFSYDLTKVKEGTNLDLSLSLVSEYYVDGENVNWDEDTSPDMQIGFVIDNTAPKYESVFGKRVLKETTTTNDQGEQVTATTNTIVVTINATDNEYIAGMFVCDETGKELYSDGSREDEKKSDEDSQYYAVVIDGNNVPDHIYAEVWDYAANVTTVQINLNKNELDDVVDIKLDQSEVTSVVGSSVTLKASLSPWGLNDQTILWSSSDESIATVENGVVKGLQEGSVTITATASADPSKQATCLVNFVYIERELNGIVWDENGSRWFAHINTADLPDYSKLSDPIKAQIASLAYSQDGSLYAASFDSDGWTSSLYTVDEDTYELTEIGPSSIGYMDIAPAPSLGDDTLIGVYGPYVVLIDKNTGDYTGAFNFANDTGGNYLVGIAFEEQYDHPSYGNTDWYFLVDEAGNIYAAGFLVINGQVYRFTPSKIHSFGNTTDIRYFQSLYYDGTDLYWSRFTEANNKTDIIFVNDLYHDGSIYILGSFNDGVWPVGGLYNDYQKQAIGINNHDDTVVDETVLLERNIDPIEKLGASVHKNETNDNTEEENVVDVVEDEVVSMSIQEPVAEPIVEEEIQEVVEIQEETTEEPEATGSLDRIIGTYTTNLVDKNYSTADVDHETSDTVTVEVTADGKVSVDGNLVAHNGLFEVEYDPDLLTLNTTKSNEKYHAFNTDEEGLVRFGYINLDGVKDEEVVATIIFDKANLDETQVTVSTLESENDFNASDEEFVIDHIDYVETLTVEPEEITLAVNDTYQLSPVVLPEYATDKSLTYESLDSSIATVDENGNITAVSEGTVTITITTNDGSQIRKEVTVRVIPNSIDVLYTTHVQNIGWQQYVSNGSVSGTAGRALRLEGIMIELKDTKNCDLGIQYTTHVQNYGWMPWSSNGELNGTTGEALRLEAIKIQLTGADKDLYDVYYRTHAQNYGWLSWAKNGEPSGTSGYAYRLEAIQIVVVPKGQLVPDYYEGITPNSSETYIHKTGTDNPTVIGENNTNIAYRSNVQGSGWLPYKYNGDWSGTSGQSKRLEAIQIELRNKQYSGSIMYNAHVQNIGWQGWMKDGQVAGTVDRYLRIEAIQIKLTDELEEHYDVYYRLHVQNYGWMAWAKNGEQSGSAGQGLRVEAIQVVLVDKGSSPPDTSLLGVRQNSNYSFVTR